MSTKNTVKLSKAVFQELIERGMNRPMIAKELGIKARLVNEAFDRWELKVKRVAEVVEWDDDVTVTETTVSVTPIQSEILSLGSSSMTELTPEEVEASFESFETNEATQEEALVDTEDNTDF